RYVSLTGDHNVSMPSTVIVPEGRRTFSFLIRTNAVDSFDPVKVQAYDGTTTLTSFLFLGPAAPVALRAPVTSIHPGDIVIANLRLLGIAGPS
ncbi:hypothetical protein ABTM30_19470, partial [Acinetobacter baumannii]